VSVIRRAGPEQIVPLPVPRETEELLREADQVGRAIYGDKWPITPIWGNLASVIFRSRIDDEYMGWLARDYFPYNRFMIVPVQATPAGE
jgi:hypothetical protein